MSPEANSKLTQMINDIEAAAYRRGVIYGASRLDMIAAVNPKSVTKNWLIQQAGKEAEALRRRVESRIGSHD